MNKEELVEIIEQGIKKGLNQESEYTHSINYCFDHIENQLININEQIKEIYKIIKENSNKE